MLNCSFCTATVSNPRKLEEHLLECSRSVVVSYCEHPIRLSATKTDSNDMEGFICYCAHRRCPRMFRNVSSILAHAKDTNCEWIGNMNGDTVRPSTQSTSDGTFDDQEDNPGQLFIHPSTDICMADETPDDLLEVSDDLDPALSQGSAFNDDLLEDDILRPWNMKVQPYLKAVLCITCESVYNTCGLNDHARQHTSDIPSGPFKRQELTNLQKKYGLHDKLVIPEGPLPQLAGLRLYPNCVECPISGCHKILGEKSLSSHHTRSHSGVPRDFSNLKRLCAQRLNDGDAKTMFEVLPHLHPPRSPVFDFACESLRAKRDAAMEAFRPAAVDARCVEPWLLQLRWHEHIISYDPEQLRPLVAMPGKNNYLLRLKQGVKQLFVRGLEAFAKLDVLILQRLRTDDPVKTGITNNPLKDQQGEATLDDYGVTIVKLLAMLLRPHGAYELELPEDIQGHLKELDMALQKPVVDLKDLTLKCQQVLFDIWTREWFKTPTNTIGDPTICCVVLMTLDQYGGWKPPSSVNPVLSHVKYCLRHIFAIAIDIHSSGEGETQATSCDLFSRWFHEKQVSTFNSLQTISHLTASYSIYENPMPRCVWIDRDHHRKMLYQGHKVEFASLHTVFREMEHDIISLWEKDVLLGTKLRVDTTDLADDLSDTRNGYSMFSDLRNDCFADRDKLVRAILEDDLLSKRFLQGCDQVTGQPVWNIAALRSWLFNYSRFEGLLLASVETKAGSPARGTELTCLQYRNTPHRRRSLYSIGGHIAVLCQYTKTGSQTGHDKFIPHSLDAVTSDLVIQNLALARPFAELAAYLCYPNTLDIQGRYGSFMFINNKELFNTTQLSEILQRYTRKGFDRSCGVNDWRHISTAFRRKLCPGMEELQEEDKGETIGAAQSGHTRNLENRIYGISADRLAGLQEDVLPLFLDVSTDWQVANRITPGGHSLPYYDAVASKFPELARTHQVKSTFIGPNNPTTMLLSQITKLLDEKLDHQLAKMVELLEPIIKMLIKALLADFKREIAQWAPQQYRGQSNGNPFRSADVLVPDTPAVDFAQSPHQPRHDAGPVSLPDGNPFPSAEVLAPDTPVAIPAGRTTDFHTTYDSPVEPEPRWRSFNRNNSQTISEPHVSVASRNQDVPHTPPRAAGVNRLTETLQRSNDTDDSMYGSRTLSHPREGHEMHLTPPTRQDKGKARQLDPTEQQPLSPEDVQYSPMIIRSQPPSETSSPLLDHVSRRTARTSPFPSQIDPGQPSYYAEISSPPQFEAAPAPALTFSSPNNAMADPELHDPPLRKRALSTALKRQPAPVPLHTTIASPVGLNHRTQLALPNPFGIQGQNKLAQVLVVSVAKAVKPAKPAAAAESRRPLQLKAVKINLNTAVQGPIQKPCNVAIADVDTKGLELLRKLTKLPNAGWRSPHQLLAVKHILAYSSDILLVMATGSGKTLTTLLPALLDNTVIVFILPLNSLINEYRSRLAKMGVQYDVYNNSKGHLRQDVNVILVSADYAVTDKWATAITALNVIRPVTRIAFDEVQILYGGIDFRRLFKRLERIRVLSVQMILMSGTIPPESTAYICTSFYLHPHNRLVLRSATDRPELAYTILPRTDLKTAILLFKRNITPNISRYTNRDRCLVFVPVKVLGEQLAEELGCQFYYGQMQNSASVFKSWIDGRHKTLVATMALGAGLDYPHIRDVVHFGTPKEMINYVQEVSRGGRDGKKAVCTMIPIGHTSNITPFRGDRKGTYAMQQYIWGAPKCYRFAITSFCDGEGVYCSDNSGKAEICRQCSHSTLKGVVLGRSTTINPPKQWPEPILATNWQTGNKRKREESTFDNMNINEDSPFDEMQQRSNHRRLEVDMEEDEYVSQFEAALACSGSSCPVCVINGDERQEAHVLNNCPWMRCHWTDYRSFKKSVNYNEPHHQSVCYHCHIPQLGDKLHTTFKHKEDCSNADIVCPIAYQVFVLPVFKALAEKQFDRKWPNLKQYGFWMSAKPDDEDDRTNMSGIFLWYMRTFRGM